ncbi:MAG: hypothetical protein IH957_04205 [Chloroflexi bacterium]|nr:hypothetical protein [Chloroflexota bacterium]
MVCIGPAGGEISDGFSAIAAILTSHVGMPLEGFEVLWTDAEGLFAVIDHVSTTDSTGSAETRYGVPFDAGIEGDETVTGTFVGTSEYGPSSCETQFHVESSALPTPTPKPRIQGDVNCNTDVDSVDALAVLQFVGGLPYEQQVPCPDIGSEVASLFGDADCDGDVDAVDSLGILRHIAALTPISQIEPCPDIGMLLG